MRQSRNRIGNSNFKFIQWKKQLYIRSLHAYLVTKTKQIKHTEHCSKMAAAK